MYIVEIIIAVIVGIGVIFAGIFIGKNWIPDLKKFLEYFKRK